jgi:prepilin-type N-terminal cleavage/methylation domain-containing protein
MRRNISKKNSGFTLVETMIAIAILSVAILGTFTAVQSSLQDAGFAKDQTTAFYLVQEAVEYVRNVRDTNALTNIATPGTDWLSGLADPSDPCHPLGKVCQIDVSSNTVASCPDGTCPVLNEDPVTGAFGYNPAWPATHFRREITLTTPGGPNGANEVLVNVTISWMSGIFSKTFTVQETLFNWH